MIQTEIRNNRGEMEKLTHDDPRYWEGPYRYEPYPKALYRKTQPGQDAETRIVKSQQEHDRLGSDWFESPADANAHFEQLEADMARADATRRAGDQRMSEKAQAEALAYERSTDEMVSDIPAPKKRGRPKKTEATT